MQASKLKLILDKCGTSQKDIAKRLGVSRWALRYWCRNPQAIKAKHIPALSSITQMKEVELYKLINTNHGIQTETE